MKSLIRVQLSVMMFLEFFIWGGWFVTLGTFMGQNLNATAGEIELHSQLNLGERSSLHS